MKFLVVGKPGTPIPSELIVNVLKESKSYANRALANGFFDCHYTFPEGGGMAICNASSKEELRERLASFPYWTYDVWEITALIDANMAYDKAVERWQRQNG